MQAYRYTLAASLAPRSLQPVRISPTPQRARVCQRHRQPSNLRGGPRFERPVRVPYVYIHSRPWPSQYPAARKPYDCPRSVAVRNSPQGPLHASRLGSPTLSPPWLLPARSYKPKRARQKNLIRRLSSRVVVQVRPQPALDLGHASCLCAGYSRRPGRDRSCRG